jgi:hypothetical protein
VQALERRMCRGSGGGEYSAVPMDFRPLNRIRRIENLPVHAEAEKEVPRLSPEEAAKQLLSSDYAMPDIGVDSKDPLNLKAGDSVAIEASDAKPGTHPQIGRLVGLNKMKTVIELENGLRLHFPKLGYFVRRE